MSLQIADHGRICTQLPVPPGREAQADTLAIKENPSNGTRVSSGASDQPAALVLRTNAMWCNERVLRVRILNGSDAVRQKIRQYANVWSQYANITFSFVEEGEAEIRVNVDGSGGSWSYVGTDNLTVDADRPTMNFGWFTDRTPEDDFASTILHEFGHALGCIHEHQSPIGKIPWKHKAVYEHYQLTQNWPPALVDRNIFQKYGADQTQFTTFDPESIMLYAIPSKLTKNGFTVGANRRLSKMDKAYIGLVYPFAPGATMVATGTFNTTEVRSRDRPTQVTTKSARFPRIFPVPPPVAVGLCSLDIDRAQDIRILAAADNIAADSLQLHISTTNPGAKIYSASCVWYAPRDADIQTGTFSTAEKPHRTRTTHRIKFPRAYTAPPEVVLWLNQMNMAKDKDWRIRAFAERITTTGFTVVIETWKDTVLYSGGASWIAYPRGKAGVVSGTYSTSDVRSWDTARAANAGRVNFPAGAFATAPTVLIALNSLEMGYTGNMRVAISTESVSATGMDWHINSWFDSVLYSAGVSYLALV